MIGREPTELAAQRWEQLCMVQEHYAEFPGFAADMMAELGFGLTDIQTDIAEYMAKGPKSLMVQAQRSQAKTTIAACFAVFSLIHSPAHRVLIISAGATQANEISTLIVRLILNVDVLACMRPDKQAGDRTSVEAFDVHHSLKGLDKSPSVACVGITSNLQGKRADLLIADDVESAKNGATATQRQQLLHLTKDFASICTDGRIIWLGTPQTMESIYNTLPARGVAVRVWPGRYPTPARAAHYEDVLAPILAQRMLADPSLQTGGGACLDQGKPIDPVILGEAKLTSKELDQGTPYFQLQHMLNTAMTDALRYPLKTAMLTSILPQADRFPLAPVRGMTREHLSDYASTGYAFKLASAQSLGTDFGALQSKWAYIDPAAGGVNGDETAYAIGGFLNGNVYLLSAGGIPGGYDLPKLQELARVLAAHQVHGATIEKNMGYGAFKEIFTPVLRQYHAHCQVDDDLVTGQKETRIINTLAPIFGRGALYISESVVEEDDRRCSIYNANLRQTYSLFFQINKLSADRNALIHDDRLDALEGLCRHFQLALAQDQAKAIAARRRAEHEAMVRNPLGYNLNPTGPGSRSGTMLRHRRR